MKKQPVEAIFNLYEFDGETQQKDLPTLLTDVATWIRETDVIVWNIAVHEDVETGSWYVRVYAAEV